MCNHGLQHTPKICTVLSSRMQKMEKHEKFTIDNSTFHMFGYLQTVCTVDLLRGTTKGTRPTCAGAHPVLFADKVCDVSPADCPR